MKKRVFIILFVISSICIILFIFNKTKCRYTEYNKQTFEKYIDFYRSNFEKIKIDIDNRVIIKNKDEIIIGKSKNELENGYYDVKILVKESYIEVYVNKLFKEFNSNLSYDVVYVEDIVRILKDAFNVERLDGDLEEIIIDNYKIIRNVKRQDAQSLNRVLNIDGINLNITVYENILVLKIGDSK